MPEYDLTSAKFHPDHGPVVVGNRPCVGCGYNLSGLPLSGNCPECAKPVRLSLLGELLQFAAPEYVKSIDTGLRVIIAAIIAYLVLWILKIGLSIALAAYTGNGQLSPAALDLILQGLMLLPSIFFIFGYWLYTTPDPGFTGLEKPTSARTIARIAACVQPGAKLGAITIKLLGVHAPGAGTFGGALLDMLSRAFSVLDFAAFATLFFAITLYTRWIAFRVPDEGLVKRTREYIWYLPLLQTIGLLLCGLGPLIALILYLSMLLAIRERTKRAIRWQELDALARTYRPPPLPRLDAPA